MPLDKVILDRALKATCLLIDKQPVNPWLVEVDFAATGSLLQPIELHIGRAVLVFELQQCEVRVNEETLMDFVKHDIKTHQTTALNGYLTIGRAIINPRPTRKSQSWFARVFTSPPKWTPPAAQWKWTSVDEVTLSDGEALVVRGKCCPVAGP